ncbi:Fc receptor-like protein 5 isoform X8 [Notolabrus celidotus]|uniref:Fc receptor-like protein 5 isoform X8 n=1 Tax=Notolabrus celidotus TaxID=1203425 RepID=UPI0014907AA4|nr:Fc receptor-like protein 5 isoform X8 [Notolabrus celidotus]
MEAPALFISLWLLMLFPLCTHVQTLDSVFLRVEPYRLQFFEYESVTFQCEASNDTTGLKTVHQTERKFFSCNTKTTTKSTVSSCTVQSVYHEDSGEYWCESGGGKRSNSINITVTAGSVILESPVLPVMEEESVTLRCRNKMTWSNVSADFYKGGILIRSSSPGEMTIHRVSTCDKGLYKCRISGGEESDESKLAVKARDQERNHTSNQPCSDCPSSDHPSSDLFFIIFRNVVPVVMMALLLVLLGLLHCGKLR